MISKFTRTAVFLGALSVAIAGQISAGEIVSSATKGAFELKSDTIAVSLGAGNPNAILIATPNWSEGTNQYVKSPIGLSFSEGRWSVVALDGSALPKGAAFNVEEFPAGPNGFIHEANANNTQGAVTTIDASRSNGQAPLVSVVSVNGSPRNPHAFAVRWSSRSPRSVQIANLNGQPIPVGAKFAVAFAPESVVVDLAPIAPNSHIASAGITNRADFLLMTPLDNPASPTLPDATTGIYHDGTMWRFFNQNLAPIRGGQATIFLKSSAKGGLTLAPQTNTANVGNLIGILGTANVAVLTKKAEKAQFRAFVTGFSCERETWDDILERDGKRDEVFVGAQWVKLGITSDASRPRILADSGLLKSPIYGDPLGAGWARIGAGSARPGVFGGEVGGIMSGDSYPNVPHRVTQRVTEERIPFLIWQGELDSSKTDERIVILPTLWEWDGPADLLTGFGRFLESAPFISLPTKIGSALESSFGASPFAQTGGTTVNELRERVVLPVAAPWAIGRTVSVNDDFFGDPHDRPIGIGNPDLATLRAGNTAQFTPYGIFLTHDVAQWISTTDFGRGAGVLAIRYRDSERLKGDYTIYVKIEKVG